MIKARDAKLQKLRATWDLFCRTVDRSKFEESFTLKGELLKEGAKADDLDLKINTYDYYVKAF